MNFNAILHLALILSNPCGILLVFINSDYTTNLSS
jgi:hypothetical protein